MKTLAICSLALCLSLSLGNASPKVSITKGMGSVHIHEDGTYCDQSHITPYFFIYNKKSKTFVEFDRVSFEKPSDFTPSKEKKELERIEKIFHSSQSDPKFKNMTVTNIATTPKSNPDVIYLIVEPK